jgi:hypothetical protein
MMNFKEWKNQFYLIVWFEYLQWNPSKALMYSEGKLSIPKSPSPQMLKTQVTICLSGMTKYDVHNDFGKKFDLLLKDINAVLVKYEKKASPFLKSELNSISDELHKRRESYQNLFANNMKLNRTSSNMKIPSHLSKHIIMALQAYQNKKKGYEKIRTFFFHEFIEWKIVNQIELNYSIPVVPASPQDDTDWARKLKNQLIETIAKTPEEKQSVIDEINNLLEKETFVSWVNTVTNTKSSIYSVDK